MSPLHATTVAVAGFFLLSCLNAYAFTAGCTALASRGKPLAQIHTAVDATSQERRAGLRAAAATAAAAGASSDAVSASAGSVFTELTLGKKKEEEEERQLREGLPGYSEDWQLREALAQCEIEFISEEEPLAADASTEVRSAAAAVMAAAAAPLCGLRHFSGNGVDGVFMGAADIPVRYRLFPKYLPDCEGGALRPGVVLLTGLMETMAKYGETITYLNGRGYSVYTYDHHGQGLSGRLAVPDSADPDVAHITNFQDYVDDLLHFSRVILPAAVPRLNVTSPAVQMGPSGREAACTTSGTTEISAVDTAAPGPGGSRSVTSPGVTSPAVEMGSNDRGGASATSGTTRVPAVDTAAPGSGRRSTRGRWGGDDRATATSGRGEGATEGSGSGGGGGGGGGDKEDGENAAVGDRLDISVVAHSMGGLTAVFAALEDPLLFKGVVLAAPMMAPNTGRLPNMVVGVAAWVLTKLGQGHRSPIRRPAGASMEWSMVTHDKSRLRLWESLRGGVGCVLQRGPSFAWLSQAVGASKRARPRLSQLSVPTLVLEAGLDVMVRSDGIQRLRRNVPSAKYRLFASAYHDLFDETDDIRLQVLEETHSFLTSVETPEADR